MTTSVVPAEQVAAGDVVVDPSGRRYTVVDTADLAHVVRLDLQPFGQCGNRPFMFGCDEEVHVMAAKT